MIRIAIVDDEREILELLFRIIDDTLKREQAQFEITTFLKAEELLSSHREKPFQIILLTWKCRMLTGCIWRQNFGKKTSIPC